MIRDFKSKTAKNLYDNIQTRHARKIPSSLHKKIQRLLDQLNAVTQVETLRVPPSNRLEKLVGDRKGYWSLRVNDKWRITFKWSHGDAHDVDIIDYH